MNTKFSIIVPCYNQSQFIYDCYISIVAQNYYSWEIIFINDGSTDDSLSILNRIKEFDKNVTVISKTNGGLSSARNEGIKNATGDYFIFLDCDDMLLPNCLSTIAKSIHNKQNLDLIQVGYRHIEEKGFTVYSNVLPSIKNRLLPNILFDNLGPVHSFCISKKLVDKNGFFDETLKSSEDWDYWIRSSFIANEIDALHIVLVDYRMNSKSMSRDSFTLYEALKKVALRGKEISIQQNINTSNIDENFKKSLKQKLALCIGVSVIQNKIKESAELLKQETLANSLHFYPQDFKAMSSYLTFRYKTSQDDVKTILNIYKPLFTKFFKEIGYSKKNIVKANSFIFSKHNHIYLKNKYGIAGIIIHKVKQKFI